MFFLIFLFFVHTLSLPVFPGCVGFGCEGNFGGSGRHLNETLRNTTIYVVTHLRGDTSEGSLRKCMYAEGPRFCIFEVSGSIRMDSMVTIRNPYITIAGETAPSPGISLISTSLSIKASDVLIKHISVRTSNQFGKYDSIGVYKRMIVLDHVSASYSQDECVSSNSLAYSYYEPHLFTISNCFITSSFHDIGPYGKGSLIGPGVHNFSIHHNLYAHHIDRNIRIAGENYATQPPNYWELYNNIFYNYKYGTTIQGNWNDYEYHQPQYGHIVKNYFIDGPNTTHTNNLNFPIQLSTSSLGGIEEGSQVYVKDNWSKTRKNSSLPDDLNVRGDLSKLSKDWVFEGATQARFYFEVEETYDDILRNSGSRPIERDQEDSRIVNHVKTRTGKVINILDGITGKDCYWCYDQLEYLEENRRSLSIPSNFWNLDSNGYTKLENWIFAFARELEVYDCFGIDKDSSKVCSSKGICVSKNNCLCNEGYSGNDCEISNTNYMIIPIVICVSILGFVALLCLVITIIIIFFFIFKNTKKNDDNSTELTNF